MGRSTTKTVVRKVSLMHPADVAAAMEPLDEAEMEALKAYVGDTTDEHGFVTRVSEWLSRRE